MQRLCFNRVVQEMKMLQLAHKAVQDRTITQLHTTVRFQYQTINQLKSCLRHRRLLRHYNWLNSKAITDFLIKWNKIYCCRYYRGSGCRWSDVECSRIHSMGETDDLLQDLNSLHHRGYAPFITCLYEKATRQWWTSRGMVRRIDRIMKNLI